MYILHDAELRALHKAAMAAFPCEACGVLLRQESEGGSILSLRFTAHDENTPFSFVIRGHVLRGIEAALAGSNRTVGGCVHSHVFGRAWPSRRDSAGARTAGELWLIYSLAARRARLFEWDGEAFRRRPMRVSRRPARAPCPPSRPGHDCGCADCRNGRGCAGCGDR